MENIFEVEYNNQAVLVKVLVVGIDTVYVAKFLDEKPLVLVRACDANSGRFWTSVPEGRQELAQQIGPLIAEQIRKTL
ncbi:MAG TPA: hypothetical protein VK563_11840 [Puia sp.]|nr:hypothetical protein [Puia sp.]